MNFLHQKNWKESNATNNGHVVHRIEAHIEGESPGERSLGNWTGEEFGYINVTYIPFEVWEDRYAHRSGFLNFANDFMGWCFREPRVIPKALHQLSRRLDSWQNRLSMEEIEAMERREMFFTYEDYMIKAVERHGDRRESEKEFHVDKPRTEYIRVAENHRRQGIGTALYEEANRWMREQFDLPLYSSSLRQNNAEAAWEKLRSEGKAIYHEDSDRYEFTKA